MRKFITSSIPIFLIVTGAIALIGLILIDQSLEKALNPVTLDQEIDLPDSLGATTLTITNFEKESLNAIYCEIPQSSHVILLCHGCQGHLYSYLELIEHIKTLDISVLAFDYRGFGLSDSVIISDETLIMDIKSGYNLLRQKNWNPQQIILYGQGLAAGIQGEFLKENSVGAWIMDNPIPSLSDAFTSKLYRLLTANRLSLYTSLEQFTGPGLVCYDAGIFPDTVLSAIQSTNNTLSFCKLPVEKAPTIGRDWNFWTTCMKEFFEKLGVPTTHQPYRHFVKKHH